MNWNEKCLMELTHHNMFEDDAHRQRFRDLLICYFLAPFFTKSLCKCMYLFSWDDEHFVLMLEVLNGMTLEAAKNLQMMTDQAEAWEKEAAGYDAEIFRLINAFLRGEDYQAEDFGVMDPERAHMIRQALKVSDYIDELPAI